MPRRPKGPHLYPRERTGRAIVWTIRDGSIEISTGKGLGERGEAEKALSDYIARKYTPEFGNGDPARVAVADILTLYAEEYAVNLRSEAPAYSIKALTPFWGDKTCADISGETCRNYAKERRRAGVGNGTIIRELGVLSAAQGFALKEKKLTSITPLTYPPQPVGRDRWLTRSEAAALLAGALGWYVAACDVATKRPTLIRRHLAWRSIQTARFILIALYTGTRHSATTALRWGVNSEGGWIDLEAGKLYRRASGERETNKRKPPVPLPDRLWGHMARARKNTKKGPIEYHGKIIAEADTGFENACRRMDLSDDITPHTLRHTAATWRMQAGADLWKTAGFLGMSLKVLTDRYGHHHPDHLRDVANA